MASIMHLSLSKESETGSEIKEKLMDEALSGKEDLTKQMEVLAQKPTLDTPDLLLLDKEPNLAPNIHAYMTPTAQQGKCFTLYSPPGVECPFGDIDETKLRPTPHGDKEHAKERDSFVKEEQLVIQANQMDSGGVNPNICVQLSHHQSSTSSISKSVKIQGNARDQNVYEEPQHTIKLAFKPNQNQGVLFSLLVKEATMGSFNIKQTCANPYDPKGYKETLWTSKDFSNINQTSAMSHTTKIIPELIKSQGKLLNSHFYKETNLFSCYVGKSVLRTKLKQGGGYDEVIQPTINQRDAKEDQMELKEQKHIMSLSYSPFMASKKICESYLGVPTTYQSFVWRPGELLHQPETTKDSILCSNNSCIIWIQSALHFPYLKLFGPTKGTINILSGLEKLITWEILNMAPRHHTYLPKLSRYKTPHLPNQPMKRSKTKKLQEAYNAFAEKIMSSNHLGMQHNSYFNPKESQYMSNTSLDSSHSSQSNPHQAKAENTQQLHSFSLNHGFVPMGFPGEVFNEAIASQGDVLDELEGSIIIQDHIKGVKMKKKAETLQFGGNKAFSLYIIKPAHESMQETL